SFQDGERRGAGDDGEEEVEEVLKKPKPRIRHPLPGASERFAAGYNPVHARGPPFVSTCPGIDPTVAAELLNHLLECMPLNEDHLQERPDGSDHGRFFWE
ncbi:hypothetical protein KUCAC02_036217, partial [Chaenocephalus aceratus]